MSEEIIICEETILENKWHMSNLYTSNPKTYFAITRDRRLVIYVENGDEKFHHIPHCHARIGSDKLCTIDLRDGKTFLAKSNGKEFKENSRKILNMLSNHLVEAREIWNKTTNLPKFKVKDGFVTSELANA